jgi:hypothetical protein
VVLAIFSQTALDVPHKLSLKPLSSFEPSGLLSLHENLLVSNSQFLNDDTPE